MEYYTTTLNKVVGGSIWSQYIYSILLTSLGFRSVGVRWGWVFEWWELKNRPRQVWGLDRCFAFAAIVGIRFRLRLV